MNTSELFRLSALADESLNVTVSEIKLFKEEPSSVKPQFVIKTNSTLFLLLLCLMIWAATVFMASGIWKARDEKVPIKHLDRVPCKNCQFFTSNHYLKCAVHPSIALTQQAIDCSDYCPKIPE